MSHAVDAAGRTHIEAFGNWAALADVRNWRERLVLLAMATRADVLGRVRVRRAELAELTHLTLGQVSSVLADLEASELLSHVIVFTDDGAAFNEYQLCTAA